MEIFDEISMHWTIGPLLKTPRCRHSSVVLNDTTLVVIGGFVSSFVDLVNLFDLSNMTWKNLDHFPSPTCEMACGVIDGTFFILCLGGEGDKNKGTTEIRATAYCLNLSTNNPIWARKPMFDVPNPVKIEFIFHHRD